MESSSAAAQSSSSSTRDLPLAPWRATVPLRFTSFDPVYMALVPRSAPLLSAIATSLAFRDRAAIGASSSSPSSSPPALPLAVWGKRVRLPQQIPVGPIFDALREEDDTTPTSSPAGFLSLSLEWNYPSGVVPHPPPPSPSHPGMGGDSPAAAASAAAQAAFSSSLKQGLAMRVGAPPPPAAGSSSSGSGPVLVPRDYLEAVWRAAKDGDPTRLPTPGMTSDPSALFAPLDSVPQHVLPVRFLLVLPIVPSAIPLPGTDKLLPPDVRLQLAVLVRTLPVDTTLREAAERAVRSDAAASRALADATGEGGGGGGGGDDAVERTFELVLHGVSADDVPGMMDTRVGELAEASLCHPDGFLYVALRRRRRERGTGK